MSPSRSPVERALQRMLEAENVKGAGDGDDWSAWQRAATDYWILLHPEIARYRRGDPARTPTISEMRDRAELVVRARDDVPETWRLAPPSRARAEHLARVGWFHEQLAGLYEPVYHAIDRLRRDDLSGVETVVRFLEADVYCFRSGYVKAEAIRFLTRASIEDETIERLRKIALAVVDDFDRREFRAYIRLGRRVDSAAFRRDLRTRLDSGSQRAARHAEWMLVGLGEPPPKVPHP